MVEGPIEHDPPLTIRITALAMWLFPDWDNNQVFLFVQNCNELIEYYRDNPESFQNNSWYENYEAAAILKMLLVVGVANGIVPDTRV